MNTLLWRSSRFDTSFAADEIRQRLSEYIDNEGTDSKLPKEAAKYRLCGMERPKDLKAALALQKPLAGKIKGNRFTLYKRNRVTDTFNSFRPIIKVRLKPGRDGCRGLITIRPTLFVLLFMLVWTVGWMYGIINEITSDGDVGTAFLFFVAMIALFAFLHFRAFLPEAKEIEDIFAKVFERQL